MNIIKNLKMIIGTGILGLGIAGLTGCEYVDDIFNMFNDKPKENEKIDINAGVIYDDFQIHFLELGNKYTGDSTYIKAGDVDILIDAGSRKDSADDISSYLDKYVTDGKLEYVIATHGDQDHIAGFVGSKEKDTRTGILYNYEIENIIMNELTNKTSQIYEEFLDAVDYSVENGANLMFASDCFNEENGATKTFILDKEKNITMDILYNKYYFEESEDENNYSVCTMFNYNDHHFLMTGDLELEGEEAMAKYYDNSTPDKTLPRVDLFKAGHHGSKTSSNDCLLEKIAPSIVCVCCCAGNAEYTDYYKNDFPTQDFIDRVAKYTDEVYVTSLYDKEKDSVTSFNGNIIISCNGTEVGSAASNHLTKLRESEWFNEEIYVTKDGKYASADDKSAIKVPRRVWPD